MLRSVHIHFWSAPQNKGIHEWNFSATSVRGVRSVWTLSVSHVTILLLYFLPQTLIIFLLNGVTLTLVKQPHMNSFRKKILYSRKQHIQPLCKLPPTTERTNNEVSATNVNSQRDDFPELNFCILAISVMSRKSKVWIHFIKVDQNKGKYHISIKGLAPSYLAPPYF